MLCDAIGQAATAAAITTSPAPGRPPVTLRFGRQTDARPVQHGPDLPGTGRALSVPAVANYIAKYATKALDAPGIPDHPPVSYTHLGASRAHRAADRARLICLYTPGRGEDVYKRQPVGRALETVEKLVTA